MIVLISGKMGSGKTTLANELARAWEKEKGHRAILINFADALYDMHNFCLGYLVDHGITPEHAKDRKLLQWLGTEWGRAQDPDLWVKIVKRKIENLSHHSRSLGQKLMFIVADCRFPNELTAFPDAYKVRLNCERVVRKYRCTRWTDTDNHESETALDNIPNYDYDVIFNTETKPANECADFIIKRLTGVPKE